MAGCGKQQQYAGHLRRRAGSSGGPETGGSGQLAASELPENGGAEQGGAEQGGSEQGGSEQGGAQMAGGEGEGGDPVITAGTGGESPNAEETWPAPTAPCRGTSTHASLS